MASFLAVTTLIAVSANAFAQPSQAAVAEELQRRMQAAGRAEQSGNPVGISETSRSVIALALRQMAQLRMAEGVPAASAELYQESLVLEDAPDAHFGLALALTRAGHLDEALKEASRATEIDPKNGATWNLLGKLQMMKKNYKAASDALGKAVPLQPDMEVAYTLASALLQQKRTEEAGAVFQKMVDMSGDPAKMHVLVGRAFEDAGLMEPARKQFMEAIKIDAKSSRAHYFLGLFLLIGNGWAATPQSREEFLKEIELNPKDFFGNYFMGYILSTEKNYAESDRYLNVAAAANPDWPEPFLYLGLNAYGAGKSDEAETYLRKAIKLTGKDEGRNDYQIRRAYFTLGRILIQKGQKEEGARYSQTSKEMEAKLVADSREHALGSAQAAAGTAGGVAVTDAALPPVVPIYSTVKAAAPLDIKTWAATDMTDNQKLQAQAAEQKLRELLGNAYMLLGSAQNRLQEYSLAVTYYHDAERWNPNTPGLMRELGLSAFLSANYYECVRALDLAAQTQPLDRNLQSMFALSLYMTKKYAEAVKAFEPVTSAAMVDPRMAYALAYSLAQTDNKPRATAMLDELTSKPAAPEALVMFGQLYSEMGDKVKAQAAYDKAKKLDPKVNIPK